MDNSDDIAEWLLWEVLFRLPSKSVVRFKLVSKRWDSLISNPLFVRSYISHHTPPSSSSWTVVKQRMINHSGNSSAFVELDLPKVLCSRKYNFARLRLPSVGVGQSYKVFGASDGLILFGLIEYMNAFVHDDRYVVYNIYYLCNPVTGESVRLPPLTARKFTATNGHPRGPALVTRVRNAVLESYRVVLLLHDEDEAYLRAGVYASETWQWKEFNLPCDIRSHRIYWAPTTLPTMLNNEIVHWGTSFGPVIAYDPYASPDRIRIIAPPPPRPSGPGSFVFYDRMCSASSGRLRQFETFTYKDHLNNVRLVLFRLWVIEDYGSGTWCLSHEADDTSVLFDGSVAARELIKDLHPMFFDPSDADVLYLSDSRRLVSYDFKTRKVEVVEEYIITTHGRLDPSFLANFLVEPSPWPISISNVPCSSLASTNLLMRGVRSLCEKFYDYFLQSN